jgi:hypothetical protein
LYSIFIESGIPMKLVRLIEMCLNETYSKIPKPIGKNQFSFSVQNWLKKGDAPSQMHFKLLRNMPLGRSKNTRRE